MQNTNSLAASSAPSPDAAHPRSDHLDALMHRLQAARLAADVEPKLTPDEFWLLVLCAACILASIGLCVLVAVVL